MPKPPKKALGSTESAVQKPPGLRTGKRTTPPPLPGSVCRTVSRLAKEFRDEHGFEEHRTAERIGRLFKSSITPRKSRGRPVSPDVRRAAEMRWEGVEWRKIYAEIIPGYADMDKYARAYPTQRLRDNVTAYLKRRKRQRSKSDHSSQGG